MNDLVLANQKQDSFDVVAAKQTEKCKEIVANAKKMVMEDPVQAARLALGMEVVKIAAKTAKITYYAEWAAKAKLHLCREVGEFVRTKIESGRPRAGEKTYSLETLGLTKNHSSNWQKLAKMPRYAWEYALALKAVPTEGSVLSEYNRYLKLKVIIYASKEKGDKGEMLRRAVEEGLTVKLAEIKYLGAKDEDDVDVTQPEDADVSDVASSSAEYMDSFVDAVDALKSAGEEVIDFLDSSKEIDKDLFKRGIEALNDLRRSVKRISDTFDKDRNRKKVK